MSMLNYSSPYLKISRGADAKYSSAYREKVGVNNDGILTPDDDGYYTVIGGAMNIINSAGLPYSAVLSKPAFAKNGLLMDKIANGTCMSEMDHPDRSLYPTQKAYDKRLFEYRQSNKCATIKEVWLDESGDIAKVLPPEAIWEGHNPVLIMLKIKPEGIHGPLLQEALDSKHSNVFFSMRTMSFRRFMAGRRVHELELVSGFDWVTHGGIGVSSKWHTSTIESHEISKEFFEEIKKEMSAGAESDYSSTIESDSASTVRAVIDAISKDKSASYDAQKGMAINIPKYLL